jgi:hypothetical protein
MSDAPNCQAIEKRICAAVKPRGAPSLSIISTNVAFRAYAAALAQASGQDLAAAGIGPRACAFAACMWKTRIFAVFSRPIVKNTRFSSVFRGFSLAFSKSLGYSAQRPGFSVQAKGRVRGWPHVPRGSRKN